MIKNNKQLYIYSFFITALVSLILYLPLIVLDNGMMVYFGDFNFQPFTFIKLAVQEIHKGNIGWNWYTDLGASFIGSYGYLGNPFFWIFAIFPSELSPYLMMPVLVLKCGVMGLFSSVYIKRFSKTYDAALIGGLLYTLSGYSIYATVFYQFHDAMAFFPLLLIALEEAVINKRRGVFALSVAINAVINIFTFVGSCFFLVIYFISRLIGSKDFRINIKDFFCLAFESIAGVMLAGVLFVPGIVQILDIPRISNIINGSEFMFYEPAERYGVILQSMFFMPEIPIKSEIFRESKSTWSSLSLYLPLFSMAGVFAFMKQKKKSWINIAIKICFLFIFIPGLNAVFIMMNYLFYFRWVYMLQLLMALATVCALEREDTKYLKYGNKVCAVITVIFSLFILLHPIPEIIDIENEVGKSETIYKYKLALTNYSVYIYIIIGISIVSIIIYGLLIKSKKKLSTEKFMSNIMLGTIVMGLITGYVHLISARSYGYDFGTMKKNLSVDLNIEDEDFYRVEINVAGTNNLSMLWGEYSPKCFHTTVPKSIFDIYKYFGIDRSGSITVISDNLYALRTYIGSKYYIVPDNVFTDNFLMNDEYMDILKTFEYYKTEDGYDIYKNKYSLPIGFTYDTYVDETTMKKILPENKVEERPYTDNLIISSVYLTDEQIEKFSDILKPLEDEKCTLESLTFERFEEDATERIESRIKDFEIYDNGNFRIDTDYSEDELVVTNVPYDKGWSATINGKTAEIECVNVGFIGIRVPAGENSIEFKYTAPGLKLGIIFSVSSALMIGGYCLYHYKLKKKDEKNA